MKKIVGLIALSLFAFSTTSHADLIVLVHGANFSKGSWSLVQEDLAGAHVQSLALDLYSAQENVSLNDVSARLCAEIRKLKTPVTLVGHSQGGAIITVAANECGNLIQTLVYVAAVYPAPGTGVFDQLSDEDNRNYNTCGYLDPKANTYDLKDLDSCRKVFMQDATPADAAEFFKTMVSEPASIGNSTVNYLTQKLAPISKYYVQTQNDLIISKATQDKIIADKDFKKVFMIESSHAPFIEKHSELTGRLIEILGLNKT